MRRTLRLLSPGLTLLAGGICVLLLARFAASSFRFGLVSIATIGLAMELTISAFMLVAIDDLHDGRPWSLYSESRKSGGPLFLLTEPTRLWPALTQLYTSTVVPSALLAFGVGVDFFAALTSLFGSGATAFSLSDVLTSVDPGILGVYISYIEIAAVVAIVLAETVLGWARRYAGGFGAALGVVIAVVAVELVLEPFPAPLSTIFGWSAVLILVGCVLLVAAWRRPRD